MDREFEGKYALVTGATSGIGADVAKLMAKRGLAGIVIVGRNAERAQKVVDACKEFGCDAYFSACDIAEVESVQKTVAYAYEVLPRIDILVNNAGVSPYDDPWDTESVEHFDFIINTNLRSQFLFCQPIAKKMVEAGYGKIVNFSSCVARTGSGLSLSYGASKGAILSFTRSLAKAVGPKGVNVNAILPGVIDTPMTAGFDYTEQAKAWPLQRMGKPEELAEAACFLASDRSSYMQGVGMDVNGGYVFS